MLFELSYSHSDVVGKSNTGTRTFGEIFCLFFLKMHEIVLFQHQKQGTLVERPNLTFQHVLGYFGQIEPGFQCG
jgi:hypothetical protein